MSNYGYTSKDIRKSTENKKTLTSQMLLLIVVTIFMLWSPFQIALFNGQTASFENAIYTAVLLSSLVGLLNCIISHKHTHWTTRKDLLQLAVWLLPFSYCISFFAAASEYYALNMILIMSMYAVFYTSSTIITHNIRLNRILRQILMGVAYIIVFFGLFHWLGNGPAITKLINWMGVKTIESGAYQDAVMTDSNGARLTSVFQYANTYAAYLMAFLFAAVFMVTIVQKWWKKAIHGFMLVPIILSIFLTLSRGGLVLLPVVFIILLVFLKPHRQLMWILHLAVGGVITLVILNSVTEIGLAVQEAFSAPQSFKGWAYILVGSIISAALSVLLERYVSPWLERILTGLANKKWGTFLLPVGGVIVGGLLLFIFMGTGAKNLLPENVQTRLENINFAQHSVLERITFYKDSAKLLADHPLIGAGGGAWGAAYEQYQNNPYTSRQAHSFYMQYIDETGIIGFILFAGFLGYILYQYIRTYIRADQERQDQYFIYFIIAASILVHSVMDFNMSYAFIGILVFICLGGMTASIDSKPFVKLKWNPKTIRIGFGILTGVISLALLITSITFVSASSSYQKASELIQTSNDYIEITTPLDKALSIRSHHPDYVSLKSNLLTQVYRQTQNEQFYDAAYTSLQETLTSEPYNKQLWMQLNALYSTKQMEQEIYDVYDTNKFRYPWDINWYEELMSISVRLASVSLTDQTLKDKYIGTVMESLKHVEDGIEHLKTLPEEQLQGRAFAITPKVALHAGQAYFMNGQTQEAYDIMKAHLQEDLTDTTNLELMRWYLASAEKLGVEDDASYAKIIAIDPNEAQTIESIVNMTLQ